MRLIRYLQGRPGAYTYLAAFALVALLGAVDYVTGAELAFSLFYLLPIALAAWLLGRPAGVYVSMASAIAWYVADVTQRANPFSAIPLWNTGIRLAFFLIVTWALSALQESRAREQALRDQEEALRQFIVHDLRGYLANILGGLSLLEADIPPGAPGDQIEILRPMLTSCRRMSVLIDSLLDQARLESGQLQIRAGPIGPRALVDAAVQQQSLWAQQQGVSLTTQVDTGAGHVFADEALILRVLLNLIGNAIKASPQGSAITVRVAPHESCQVVFSVADQGPGVPKEWATKVFDRYAQVEIRKARGTVGTGLGLTFCKLAVEAHSGRIWLESEPPQGTTLFFTLPRAGPARASPVQQDAGAQSQTGCSEKAKGAIMLVVHVFIHVKPEHLAAFEAATLENARQSVQEPGVARFDVIRQQDDPSRFVLVEVYRTPDAPAAHKATAHYARWRDAVEGQAMLVEPRYSIKYENLFPEDGGW